MGGTALETVLRRDRYVVAGALAVLTLLSWAYIAYVARTMSGMDMSGMDMPGMDMAPAFKPWGAADFAFMLTMWTVMMVGMMTPSAAPMVLLYARVGRQAASTRQPFAATGWFAAGYLAAWSGFAVAAILAQWGLEQAALMTSAMTRASDVFGGSVLIAAGLFQWTKLKESCLSACRAPLSFVQRHGGFRPGALDSLRLGALHGAYCVGCCWALMALLFVGGVMNLLWIAGLAALVLVEKIVPAGKLVARTAGVVMAGAGLWLVAASLAG